MIEVITDFSNNNSAKSWIVVYSEMSNSELASLVIRGDKKAKVELEQRLRAASTGAPKAVEPDIIKAGRNDVTRALAALKKLPDAEPGLIAVPWPRRDRPKVENAAWADSHLKLWPIEDLFATQKFVKREVVEWHLKNLGIVHEGAHSNPNILVVDGEPRIYDGHHRLAALWLLYVAATNCWTLDLEEVS